ncbi:unnamed protein product [Moneuplotes crassus]|uniref:Fanconi-associated nuclease n=1 Tax=Euplotes crassus TaxID=5936 RepID=A0AAD1XWL6_EUPCR|nr:unnamed protein product [Moneuplotes crassus]
MEKQELKGPLGSIKDLLRPLTQEDNPILQFKIRKPLFKNPLKQIDFSSEYQITLSPIVKDGKKYIDIHILQIADRNTRRYLESVLIGYVPVKYVKFLNTNKNLIKKTLFDWKSEVLTIEFNHGVKGEITQAIEIDIKKQEEDKEIDTDDIERSNKKYLDVVERILKSSQAYPMLFNAEEIDIIDTFTDSDHLKKVLISRMFFRKRVFFNLDHIKSYSHSEDELKFAIKEMKQSRLIETGEKILLNPRGIKIFLDSLTIAELKPLAKNIVKNFKCFVPIPKEILSKLSCFHGPISKIEKYIIDEEGSDDLIQEFKKIDFEIWFRNKSQKNKLIMVIIERIEAYKRSEQTEVKKKSKKATLHAFFKGNSELVKKVKKECVILKTLQQSIPEFFSISYSLRTILFKCAKLFCSFQSSDPRSTLLNENYISEEYAEYDNYLCMKLEHPLKLTQAEFKYLRPLFKDTQAYDSYINMGRFRYAISSIIDLEYPKEITNRLIKTVSILILKNMKFIKNSCELADEKIDSSICEKSSTLLKTSLFHDTSEYYRENSEKLFFSRFAPESYNPWILDTCVEYLEKIKEYKFAIMLLLCLVQTSKRTSRRDKWIHRLGLDCKHIKEFVLSYCICLKALTDVPPGCSLENPSYCYLKNSILITKNSLQKKLEKLYRDRSKFMINLTKKLKNKNISKRMPKQEFEQKVEEYDQEFNQKVQYIQLLDIEHLFTSQKELNKIPSGITEYVLEKEYDSEYFSEVTLSCKKMTNLGDEHNTAKYRNPKTNEIFSVEDLALHYYHTKEGYDGIHSENRLGMVLFGLFLWKQIFDDTIPGVFQTPYQRGPLDFGSKEFFYRREAKITQRLDEICKMGDEDIEDQINTLWDSYNGTINCIIEWDSIKFSKIKLIDISKCLGGKNISHILLKYAYDWRSWSHGLPDLFLWNIDTKRAKFSEIKSETDRLSDIQKAWIAYLSKGGIKIEVCYLLSNSQEALNPF